MSLDEFFTVQRFRVEHTLAETTVTRRSQGESQRRSVHRFRRSRATIREMADVSDNAGVRFPPPLLYALAVVGGVLLNREWPLPVGHGSLVTAIATILCVGSVALAVTSLGRFRRAGTTPIPRRPATALVISGPYRFTRNPMYVSMAGLTVGLGLFLNTWWPMLGLVPVLMIVRFAVIAREERYLRRRFGDDYETYTRKVRRWL